MLSQTNSNWKLESMPKHFGIRWQMLTKKNVIFHAHIILKQMFNRIQII